jgi:hypothetical protein
MLAASRELDKLNDHKIDADIAYAVARGDISASRASWDATGHVVEPHQQQEHAMQFTVDDLPPPDKCWQRTDAEDCLFKDYWGNKELPGNMGGELSVSASVLVMSVLSVV